MRTMAVSGCGVAWLDEGLGEPIVFLHSGGSSGSQWRRLMAALPQGCRRIAPDLWGAGRHDLFADEVARARRFEEAALEGRSDDAWREFVDGYNGAGAWARFDATAKDRLRERTGDAVAYHHSNLSNETTLAALQRIRLPVTVAYGESTGPSTLAISRIVHQHIAGASLVCVGGAGHMAPITHPEQVARIVMDHLANVASR